MLINPFNMFSYKSQKISLEDLRMLQLLTQQVVLSLDCCTQIPNEEKRCLAESQVDGLLFEIGLRVPPAFTELAIDVGFILVRQFNSKHEPDRQEPLPRAS